MLNFLFGWMTFDGCWHSWNNWEEHYNAIYIIRYTDEQINIKERVCKKCGICEKRLINNFYR